MVDVEQRDPWRRMGVAGVGHRFGQRVIPRPAVGQSGQRVGVSQREELVEQPLALSLEAAGLGHLGADDRQADDLLIGIAPATVSPMKRRAAVSPGPGGTSTSTRRMPSPVFNTC